MVRHLPITITTIDHSEIVLIHKCNDDRREDLSNHSRRSVFYVLRYLGVNKKDQK